MAVWNGSPISVEEAFNQVWKSSVHIQPSFYHPVNVDVNCCSEVIDSPKTDSVCSTEDELATAEILARIKFGTTSPQRQLRKRSMPSSMEEEDDVKPMTKRKKESSVESMTSGTTNVTSFGAAERWPPRKEFVYLTCVVAIPPVGRQKLPLFGKPCGRNEIIAKVVTLATGEGCSRKLISSHAQVLKGRKELSKQLRDLLTTEEGRNNDDEAAPVVYTLGAEWHFPKSLNRLIGLSEDLDLRNATPPSLIIQHFNDIIKASKLANKKERATSSNKNNLTIRPRPSKSVSPSILSSDTTSTMNDKVEDHNIRLPTPNSWHPSSSFYPYVTPSTHKTSHIEKHDYGYDNNQKPALPSPNDLFSPVYNLSTPHKYPEYSHTTPYHSIPRRPATADVDTAFTTRVLPPPESPISSRYLKIESPYITPINPNRRTSESHLTDTLGKPYSAFEVECLKIGNNYERRISGVTIEDIKRQERFQQLC
ncbi:uncharacterized protein I206_104267 [Kwoniella pini CBS 10737]|uniref:TEA domain-containing protein n=1 Tax=Kwoniella pini CBS 10737 TaxID=1296096 RepID=A0A1B9I2B3_9TREE|nr:uncharacterized protein I206_04157 [Kwoniella pini CBS 10737]OCF49635.1 hypothetical protein I206_04157 [Kwoniella pini CBS 10737]